MGRLAWSQLRFRTVRLVALLAGLLLATTAFTVLTAASRTAQLRTVGTVTAHFVPAYDILVRPKGSRTALETRTDTVQPNFLSGLYGGITMAQYRQIASIPGVQVAAPIAMVGYTLLASQLSSPLPAADLSRPGRQLYRVTSTWISQGGTSRVTQPPSYVYVTPQRLGFDLHFTLIGPKIAQTTTHLSGFRTARMSRSARQTPALNLASIRSAWPRSQTARPGQKSMATARARQLQPG